MKTDNQSKGSKVISATDIETAFPEVPVGIKPLGARILVQLRLVREKTKGGLIIAPATKEFNESIAQFAKILAVGPLAFCNRTTGEPWPEGIWAQVGDIVRVPRYGGDRMARVTPEGNVVFALFDDHLIGARIDSEVLESLDELV